MTTRDIENLPHYVYVIQCTQDSRVYYGSTHDPKGRWKGHRDSRYLPDKADRGLYKAMTDHGVGEFSMRTIAVFPSRKIARDFETGCIVGAFHTTGTFNLALPDGRLLSSIKGQLILPIGSTEPQVVFPETVTVKGRKVVNTRQGRRLAARREYWEKVRNGEIEPPLDWVEGRIIPQPEAI